MLPTLIIALAAGQFVAADDLPLTLSGECIYPPTLATYAPNATPLLCNTVVAQGQEIEFRQRQLPDGIHFTGTWRGAELQIKSMRVWEGKSVQADGTCRIYFANDAISVVTCTAIAGGKSYVANFRSVSL